MRVRLLGPLHVGSGSMRLGPRDRVVLSALAVHPGESLGAEALADALWQDRPPASWAKVVQGCISRLRTVLGADAIATEPGGYRLEPQRVELDRDDFERLVSAGREHLAVGSPERAASAFTQALDLWRGRPFDELEEWMPGRLEATRLHELRLAVQEDLLQARLDAGQHREVASEGTVLVGEEPWRERRWELLALAQYRSGRQAEALGTIRAARRNLGQELGLDPGSGLVALEQAILAQDPSLVADHEARAASSQCPWMGLASYDPEDTDTFFGRTDDVTACLDKLDRSPLLALVGPSGSGKSSLMKAGVVPALRTRGENVVTLSPGADPAGALAAARAASPRGTVLCIDQFEEVFTGGIDRSAVASWLGDLAEYADQRGKVVVTVRSDYVAELSAQPTFAGLVERGLHLVAPLEGEALREVVEGPAQVAGLRLEHGLVDLLLRDAEGQPGALPLLSHALAETWRRREDSLLTVDGYRASGGISGAVAASADRLCDSLSESGRAQLRWLMLRMGSLAEHGEPVRTPVPRQVATDDPERARVVDLLVRARLVTSVDGSYELAHESLVRAWPQLRSWLEEDRDGQRLWRHLAAAAAEWDVLGRPASELYQGIRLETTFEWASRPGSEPTRLEREFLDASAAHADEDRLALAMQARKERRNNRRLRGLLVATAVLLVMSLLGALLAVDQQRTAADQRDSARESRGLAQHQSLVARSLGLRSSKRAVAALLAVEAHRTRPDALAESALLGVFTAAPGFLGYTSVPYQGIQGDTIPGTGRAVVASGARAHVLDLDTGRLGAPFEHPVRSSKALNSVLRVSGDGRRVAQLVFAPDRVADCGDYERLQLDDGVGCTLLIVFDIATGKPVFGPVSTPIQGGDVAINHSGSLVAVVGGFDGDLITYDVVGKRMLGRLAAPPRPPDAYNERDTGAVAFGSASHVYVSTLAGDIREVDARRLRVVRTLPTPVAAMHNFMSFTRDGLLVGSGDRGMVAVDTRSGTRRWSIDFGSDPRSIPCFSFAVAAAIGRLYCGTEFGEIHELDLADGRPTGTQMDSQLGQVGDLAVSGGNELVEFSRGYFSRWRLDGSGAIARLVAPGAMTIAGYAASGRYLHVGPRGRFHPQRIIDLASGEDVARFEEKARWVWWLGGDVLFLGGKTGVLAVDAASGRRWMPPGMLMRTADGVFPGVDDATGWAVLPSGEEAFTLQRVDLETGRGLGEQLRLEGFPFDVAPAADGKRLWVSYWQDRGTWLTGEDELNFRGSVVDLVNGTRTDLTVTSSAFSRGGRLVGGDMRGDLWELDPETGEAIAALAGSRGRVAGLQFSASGKRLIASGRDGRVQVHDTETWISLGAIPSGGFYDVTDPSIVGPPDGYIRPDGQAVAVNERLGVVEWSLDPREMAHAACRLAGRNLTRSEWSTYMMDQPYRRTCPEYPAGE
jgi:DNA-binding SARP family transcriptional activator/outer membrane protein assembly factor BamB